MTDRRSMLCHFIASIAYHMQKALREASEPFASFSVGAGSRTPQDLVRHMESVLGYARTFFNGGAYENHPMPTLGDEVRRLHTTLQNLVALISGSKRLIGITKEQLLQGPLSDAMTYVGQITYLRRLYGSPVPSENFIYANISARNVSTDQPMPNRPDPDWRS